MRVSTKQKLISSQRFEYNEYLKQYTCDDDVSLTPKDGILLVEYRDVVVDTLDLVELKALLSERYDAILLNYEGAQ